MSEKGRKLSKLVTILYLKKTGKKIFAGIGADDEAHNLGWENS